MEIVSVPIGVSLNLAAPFRLVTSPGGSVGESTESKSAPLSVPASQAKRSTSSSSIQTPPGLSSMFLAPTNQSGDSLRLARKVRLDHPRVARLDANVCACSAVCGNVPPSPGPG